MGSGSIAVANDIAQGTVFPHCPASPPPPPCTHTLEQLADFLVAPMARSGGMMPLPDVYCLYNRARGTELISPDDLASAVKLFPQVGYRVGQAAGAGLGCAGLY